MPYGPTPRLGLIAPLGSEQINQGDDKFRALVDQLDAVLAPFSFGLLSARPTSTSGTPGIQGRRYRATDAFTTFRDTGTSWEIESQTPQIVTSLPSGTGIPFDGQEIYFQASATNGIVWHLRYRAAATGSYKWEFIGGAPLSIRQDSSVSTTSVPPTYVSLGSDDLSFALPLAGDYTLEYGYEGNNYGRMAMAATGLTADSNASAYIGASGGDGTVFRRIRQNGISGTLKAQYAASLGTTAAFNRRYLEATPIRLG